MSEKALTKIVAGIMHARQSDVVQSLQSAVELLKSKDEDVELRRAYFACESALKNAVTVQKMITAIKE